MQISDRIGSRMKLQDLHVLMMVVQEGSMGKAAQRLNTTQPNVSRSIRDLEDALGVRLLDRHPRGTVPTDCGRALLDCGVSVFDGLRQGVKHVEFLADPASAEVRIGTTPFFAAGFVSAVIDRLSETYPKIVFRITTGYVDALHRELSERNVDLLVVRSPGQSPDDRLEFESLFDDHYVVAAGHDNHWTRRRKLALSELINESWVLPPRESVIGTIIAQAFHTNGLDYPRATVVTDSPHMRLSLLATGRFITVFPDSALSFLARTVALKVLAVHLPSGVRPNGIVTLKNRALNPGARLFIESAKKLARAEVTT